MGTEILKVRAGVAARVLVAVLMAAVMVLYCVSALPVRPAGAASSEVLPLSVATLPATETSATGARLNGEITALGWYHFVTVEAGYSHSLGVCADGSLWAWGFNDSGRLGVGDTSIRTSPARVGSDADWVDVSGGVSHSLGVRSDGSLWAWGSNAYGQLGLGEDDTTDRHVPTQVGNSTDWAAVFAGDDHSFGVRSDGTLWAWGRNRARPPYDGDPLYAGGQLGVGDKIDRHVPTQVGVDTGWTAISGGVSHSLGVRSDGTLWAWGWNPHGELGLGEIGQDGVTTPTRVGAATNWVGVAAGTYRSLGVRSDGTLWAWGMNGYGELGVPASPAVKVPTQVGRDTNWVAVCNVADQFMGLRSDGTVWAWGGQESNVVRSPTEVGDDTDWTAISAGSGYFLGLRTESALWARGRNNYGQLGLGTTADVGSPEQVILVPPSCQVSFEWGLTSSYGNETTPQTVTDVGAFGADIDGLTFEAIYHFRAKVVSDLTVYGADRTLVAVGPPSVTTGDAEGVTASSARLKGDLSSLGTAGSVTVSFAWGTRSGITYVETPAQTLTGAGEFHVDLTGLDPASVYYYRAKAVGHGEAVYGVEKSFVTGLNPVVQGVNVASVRRGQRVKITVAGSNLSGATNVSFGSGVTVLGFAVSGGAINAEIAVDRHAELGVRSVSVTTPMGTGTMTGALTVKAAASVPVWVYLVAILVGVVGLLVLVAVGARLLRRFAT